MSNIHRFSIAELQPHYSLLHQVKFGELPSLPANTPRRAGPPPPSLATGAAEEAGVGGFTLRLEGVPPPEGAALAAAPMALSASTEAAIQRVAAHIKSSTCKSVCLLTGAGMSVAAGIPDFRSPGGMYETLKPDLITATAAERELMRLDPTYVVERGMFLANQFPYLEVRRPFILGTAEKQWKATLSHHFARLLHERTGKLTRLYTQNIDGLDFQLGLPADMVVCVHGTIGKVSCEACGAASDHEEFCQRVRTNIKDIYGLDSSAPATSSHVLCAECHGATLKPTTVLFGAQLPTEFFERKKEDLPGTDLVIVAGTSLVVSPANKVAQDASGMRFVVNREPVGRELGIVYEEEGPAAATSRDIFAAGECDAVFLRLAEVLGWRSDLEALAEEQGRLPDASRALILGGGSVDGRLGAL